MLVIALTKVPRSLRGDLTKWCQEIQTGIYVGNVNARVRDALWQRVMDNIGRGEATMVYNTNNELGYQFRTTRADKKVIDYDGIPLLMTLTRAPLSRQLGFSKAYRRRQAAKFGRRTTGERDKAEPKAKPFVVADVETTGLDFEKDQIISIGAVKEVHGERKKFYRLVRIKQPVPQQVSQLTGISDELLAEHGVSLKGALRDLCSFVGEEVIISYNGNFDRQFLQRGCDQAEVVRFNNVFVDLLRPVKKVNLFLDNYRLSTVLEKYKIKNKHPHNALADAEAEFELATKLIKTGDLDF